MSSHWQASFSQSPSPTASDGREIVALIERTDLVSIEIVLTFRRPARYSRSGSRRSRGGHPVVRT
jgi:hypothetical protein